MPQKRYAVSSLLIEKPHNHNITLLKASAVGFRVICTQISALNDVVGKISHTPVNWIEHILVIEMFIYL